METKAAVAYKGEPAFKMETVKLDSLRSDEILVRVKGVGLCHTDLVFKSGAAPYPFPAVFGHEGSGVVEAVGGDVTKVAPGDHVLMTFRSCGDCDRCDTGDAAYCRTMPNLNYAGRREDETSVYSNDAGPVSSNFFGQSSFAAHAVTYERNLVKVEKHLPIELLGPLGCGIQTGAGAVMRSLNAPAGSAMLITGGGSVGLSAVMGSVIQGCSTIILVEPMAKRRRLAMELGATHTIDPAATADLAEAIRSIVPLGVDNALDTTGIPDVLNASLASLGSKGTLGLVGVAAGGTPLPGEVNAVMALGQSVKGIIEGDSDPDVFLPELLKHYEQGRLPIEKLIKTFKLSQINEAIADQHSGGCVKAILLPGA